MSLQKAAQLAPRHGGTIVLAGLRHAIVEHPHRSERLELEHVEVHDELDRRVDRCEDRSLAEHLRGATSTIPT